MIMHTVRNITEYMEYEINVKFQYDQNTLSVWNVLLNNGKANIISTVRIAFFRFYCGTPTLYRIMLSLCDINYGRQSYKGYRQNNICLSEQR